MTAASETSLELEELLTAFGSVAAAGPDRQVAMAQFLSGAEGWRQARETLGGTFAGLVTRRSGLTPEQD
ncbi:MAG: hypothetical protein M3Q57_00315 [Pseudomonadota bacterium]|nr:hypothetical protein [Pseudomonadota bacterium]